MTRIDTQRRLLLQGLGLATLLPTRLALAASNSTSPEAPRLVVVMLRGALDGLAAVPAPGDPAWAALRGADGPAPLPLDGFFGLHPALTGLQRWWGEGQLLLLHAAASPYRERSHFDAQQLLESGGERPFELGTGWLGRALQASGQGSAVALSSSLPLALRGAQRAGTWTPARRGGADEDLLARVGQLYQDDAALSAAWQRAMAQQGMLGGESAGTGNGFAALARQAGTFLAAEQGPRVAWLEANGWDTHTNQAGRLQRLLAGLDEGLLALREALGAQWPHSTVLVMTEFGRSAVLNGSGGTDHGTAGMALLAGGAVAGGKVLTDWPGLARTQLLDGRDLRPTLDLRQLIAALLQRQFGLSQAQLAGGVLPGVSARELALWRA
ncbi:DUF1501 domain-containing protein [Paucibacter sp. M5-1]|uniref:DUF1501 domain-containing protein n=1 Tax=Paucibacter sp. M5-1 TaxID=3015998 RepID=UPI0022B87BDC|nr:DUF1501 domain-containing protein [Paucibacter sp. M5-1]MCZ7882065.1 DUF1501 domain-containing protein [Paucibacter sp. M5-1]